MRGATLPPLPNDVATLHSLVMELQTSLDSRDAALQERDAVVQAGQQELVYLRSWVEKLKLEVARLRRMQFGRSSEQLASRIEQLELTIEEFEANVAQKAEPTPIPVAKQQPKRHVVARAQPARENRQAHAAPGDLHFAAAAKIEMMIDLA